MNTFLWAVIVIFALDVLAMAVILAKQDATRNLALVPFDMIVNGAMLAWAVILLL